MFHKLIIFIITCHGGPADHFATFIEQSNESCLEYHVQASGPALVKLQQRHIAVEHPFSLEGLTPEQEDALAVDIAKNCRQGDVVMTDVGHPFAVKVQRAIREHAPEAELLAYYDNPEPYVPGGYSEWAAEAMKDADRVLFANARLASVPLYRDHAVLIDLPCSNRDGIGYYPLEYPRKIEEKRMQERSTVRQKLFGGQKLRDDGQEILVYFGGNNPTYFTQAFPAFLNILEGSLASADLSRKVVLIQQHPGARDNIEGFLVSEWLKKNGRNLHAPSIIIPAGFTTDDALTVADTALYYQTSMAPQFVLAGIPAIQIGHETYQDILVRERLAPSVTNTQEFLRALEGRTFFSLKGLIEEALGIHPDWPYRLERSLQRGS